MALLTELWELNKKAPLTGSEKLINKALKN
jgi:hypothetical protein